MRRAWALALLAALLLAPTARADPALSSPGPGEGQATWTFSNPANYTLDNAVLGNSAATLAWYSGGYTDTSLADFSAATSMANIDLLSSPGDVLLADTSAGSVIQSVVLQPGPSAMADNYLYKGNGGAPNFGTVEFLHSGNNGGGEWTRSVLRFPALPLPSNATVVSAALGLYFYDPITTNAMEFSAHRITTSWTETGSNWDTSDGTTLWNTTGGDFDPTALDTVAGIATTPGWFSWNVTSLVQAWWTGAVPNQGIMVRQTDDAVSAAGEKGFYSSDTANATVRPRLVLNYTTPSARGTYVSRAFDAVGTGAWQSIWWNVTAPAGTGLAVRTRTGDTYPADGSWSPWSAAYSATGSAIRSPPARYLEYELDLLTSGAASPAVHDVSLAYGRYAVAGRVSMEPFGPTGVGAWGQVKIDAATPPGTTVSLAFSQDGGASWLPAADGQDLSSALPQGMLLRVDLITANTTLTPVVRSVSLIYRTEGGGLAGAGALPWWILLAALLGILALLAYRRRAGAFTPLELYLIHKDGKLVGHAGRGTEMRDELASSAMFTLVLQFVKDSFGGRGTGGELRDFKVDEKEVVIARGAFLYLAMVGAGTPSASLPPRMNEFLSGLETMYGARLGEWNGLREGLQGLEADLAWFLERGYRRARRKRAGGYHE